MVLPVPPQVFDRGEFRSIGRQLLDDDPFGLPRQILPDQPTAVSGQAAPDHQQLTLQLTRELWQETDHLGTADRPVTEAEAQVPQGDPDDGRVRLQVEVMRDHRGLPTWGSSARPARAFRQPARAQARQGAPDMTGLAAGPVLLLDQLGHPVARPQPGAVLQSSFPPHQIRPAQAGFPSCVLQISLASIVKMLTEWQRTPTRLTTSAWLSLRRRRSPAACSRRISGASGARRTPRGFPIPQNRPTVTISCGHQ